MFYREYGGNMNKKDEKIQKVVNEFSKHAGRINDKAAHKFANYQLPIKAAPSKGTQTAITISIVLGGAALVAAFAGQLLHTLKYHRNDRGSAVYSWRDDFEDKTSEISSKVADTVDDVTRKVQDKADEVSDKAEDIVDDAKKTARRTAKKLK